MSEKKFNAQAQQTVFLKVTRGSKRYDVEHLMNPLSDEDFARLNDAAAVKAEDGQVSSEFDRVVNEIWESKVVAVSGYALSEDFKKGVPLDDRRAALRGLDTGRVLVEEAAEDELVPLDDRCEYKLRVIFDGNPIVTKHVLRAASTFQERQRNKIIRECAGTVGKAGELVARMAKIYDALAISTEGYEGALPSSHKFLIVEEHLRQQAISTEKN